MQVQFFSFFIILTSNYITLLVNKQNFLFQVTQKSYLSNGNPPEITALIRRTPADDDCSFWILKSPI